MVALDGVTKRYRGVVAVSEVTCELGPGVTAVLGPNGAGKSTVLRLACGLTRPTDGVVRIHGHDPRVDPRVSRFVGVVPQHHRLLPRTTALRFVELAGVLSGVDDPHEAARASLEAVELDPDDHRHTELYSNGMRQRVKIAQALVTGPSILVVDEPLNGLDPRQRERMIETLRGLGAQGRCVLISSHVLDEVERFGSRVVVLDRGRLVAEGDVHGIRELMDDRPHHIRIGTDRPTELAAAMLKTGSVTEVVLRPDALEVACADVATFARALAPAAIRVGAELTEVRPLDDDLESVFRYLTQGARAS
jgi:ABC-2 type transport system ATP-binding protein